MTDPHHGWSRRIAIEDVPEEGLHVELAADSAVRAALARTAGLRDLPRLDARFDLQRKGRERLHVTGEISGELVQDCIITLEPIIQNLLERVDLVFVPEVPHALADGEGEASFGLTDAEPPEPLVGGAVDLGEIATEYFLLGIDPYPRKEGAVFETASAGTAGANPFAALAALKKPPLGTE